MSEGFGNAINSFADWICRASLVRTVMNNAFLTALLITALVAVVILAMYRAQLRAGGLKKKARAFLYIFLGVVVVMYLHHYVVTCAARDEVARDGVREVFAGIGQSQAVGGAGLSLNRDYGGSTSASSRHPEETTGGDCGCDDGPQPVVARPVAARPVTRGGVTSAPRGPHRDNVRLANDLVLEDVQIPMRTTR